MRSLTATQRALFNRDPEDVPEKVGVSRLSQERPAGSARQSSRMRPLANANLKLIALILVALATTGRTAGAQVMIAGNEEEEGAANQGQVPFLLPAQPTEVGEAMEDFRRFAGRKQWEKAFKHLEKVFNATSNGLVLTADGIMLPSRMIAREALLDLPPAGQDAYQLVF